MATEVDAAARDGAHSVPSEPAGDDEAPVRRPLAAVLLPILLLLVAGTLRFTSLGYPQRTYFDEVYYAHDAEQYLTRGVEEGFVVHPPVGKWLIATGLALLGDRDQDGQFLPIQDDDDPVLEVAQDALSWRLLSAAAGTLTVLVAYLAGLRLFRRRGIAALAALLLTVDGLAFTMSRIAMLDVFLALFVVTGFWLLLIDRDRQWAGVEAAAALAAGGGAVPRRPHPYRWLAGLVLGLAVATKWSGILAIGAAGVFVLGSELAWRRTVFGRVTADLGRMVASGLLTLVLVPVLVYLVSYTGWFANFPDTRPGQDRCPEQGQCDLNPAEVVDAWWGEQREIARFHQQLEAEHPYRASPVTWLLMQRPVAYYFEACDDPANPPQNGCVVEQGNVEEILGIGNPLLWWLALPSYLVLLGFAGARRDWRAAAILAFLLAQMLPWFLTNRPIFLFYMTPVVPFMCLSVAYSCWHASRTRGWRWLPAVVLTACVLSFWFFWPVLTGTEIPRSSWNLRIWMSSWV